MFRLDQPSDASLVRRVLAGRRDEFGKLVERYLAVVHATAYAVTRNHADADDVTQDTFLKAFQSLDSLETAKKFGAWLVTIARNAATGFVRTQLRRRDLLAAHANTQAAAVQQAEDRELRDALERELDKLDPSSREILLMHYYARKSTKEIAALLDVSLESAKKRLQRARQKLNEQMLRALRPSADFERAAKDRAGRIMGIVSAAPVTWDITAASGTGVAGATAAKVVGGTLIMKKFAVGMGGIALLVAGWLAVTQYTGSQDAARRQRMPETSTVSLSEKPVETSGLQESRPAVVSLRDEKHGPAVTETMVAQTIGPSSAGSIRVNVIDQRGKPVNNASVKIEHIPWAENEEPRDDALRRSAATDEKGAAVFQDLPLGEYAVKAEHDGASNFTGCVLNPRRRDQTVSLMLESGGPIAGIVVDTAGAPVPDAWLLPAEWVLPGKGSQTVEGRAGQGMRTQTDARGAFAFETLRQGEWRFQVDAKGYAKVVTEPIAVGELHARITLRPGGGVAGEVVLAQDNTPIPDVQVAIIPDDVNRPWVRTRTDAGGQFLVENLAAGSYTATLDDPVFAVVGEASVFDVVAGQETTGVTILVTEGGRIAGRVFDKETQEGIGGVEVYAEPSATAETIGGVRISASAEFVTDYARSAVTDEHGHYEVTGLVETEHVVRRGDVEGYPDTLLDKATLVIARLGETVAGVDFPLSKGLQVTGRVVDLDGAAVEQALVQGFARAQPTVQRTHSGPDGFFVLTGFNAGVEVQLRGRLGLDLASGIVGPMAVPDDGLHDVVVTLHPTGSISGMVVEQSGRPVADVQVLPMALGATGGASDESDEAGRFSLTSLPPATYRMILSSPGSDDFDWNHEAAVVELAAGQQVTGLRLVVNAEGLSIAGCVTDLAGNPVAGARVLANVANVWGRNWSVTGAGGQCTTSDDGCYRVGNLPEGSYTVGVIHPRYTMAHQLDVPAGSEGVDFMLEGRGAVEGRVIRADSGRPIPDFEAGFSQYGNEPTFMAFHDEEGRFHIEDIQSGPVTVVARAEGFAMCSEEIADVPPDETVTDVLLRLEPAVPVTGIVTGQDGTPILGALVFLGPVPYSGQRNEWFAVAKSRDDGTFDLESVPSGTDVISAYHPNYAPGSAEVGDMSPDGPPIEIILAPAAVIEGVVRLGAHPLPRHTVTIHCETASLFATAISEEDGSYMAGGLEPGQIAVVVDLDPAFTSPGVARTLTQNAVVTGGEVMTLNLVFGDGDAALEGAVVASGVPCPQAGVVLRFTDADGAEERMHTTTGADGRYSFENLPPLSGMLEVAARPEEGQVSKSVGVDVPLGGHERLDIELSESEGRL